VLFGIIEKVECRLAVWKQLYLSKRGRIILIKSTFSNLPTSCLCFPSLLALPIELHWDFLWGSIGEEVKFHMESWSKVCSSIIEVGLGVQNLLMFNRALLGKWLLCFAYEREACWRMVVVIKYGSQWGGYYSNEVIGSYGAGLWKFIRRGWKEFFRYTRFKVGDDSKISFWHGVWCGEQPLKVAFPELYRIVYLRDNFMADHLQFHNGSLK
jgi:hypothetical protein